MLRRAAVPSLPRAYSARPAPVPMRLRTAPASPAPQPARISSFGLSASRPAIRRYSASSIPPSGLPSASTIVKDLANSNIAQKAGYYIKLGWRAVVQLVRNTKAANQIKKRIKYGPFRMQAR